MSKFAVLIHDDEFVQKLFPAEFLSSHKLDFFTKAQNFAESFTIEKYDLLIADLSQQEFQADVEWVIHYVRSAQKSKIPILILANTLGKAQLNHFLEIGVDDFLYLPIDGHYLKKKINDLAAGKIVASDSLKVSVNEIESLSLKMSFKLKSISETGIELEAGAYVARGTKVRISSELIASIFKVDSIFVTVQAYTSVTDGLYVNFCEFDTNQKDQLNLLKMWLSDNSLGSNP